MTRISLTLPYPPQANHLYSVARGRKFLSTKGRKYKQDVEMICLAAKVRPIDGPVSVSFRAYRPRKSGDLDNIFKAIFDGIKGHVWRDDRQIVEIHAYRDDDKANPRVEIEVREI